MDFFKDDLVEDLRKKYNSPKWIYSKEEMKSRIEDITGSSNTVGRNLFKLDSTNLDNILPLINFTSEDNSEPEFSYTEEGFRFNHIKIGSDEHYDTYYYNDKYIPKENISIEIDKYVVVINGKTIPISNIKGFKFDLGRDTMCNCYELEFLTTENEVIKFCNYCKHRQVFIWGPLAQEPDDKFYPIWNKLLNAIEKFLVPHIFGYIMNELFERRVYSFGRKSSNSEFADFAELKVTAEGAFMTREILSLKREVLVPWNKLLFESYGKDLWVSSKQVAINRKSLYKTDWNVPLLPIIQENMIQQNNNPTSMINPFRKAIEYNNLAKTFNGIYLMIQQIKESNPVPPYELEDLYALAYIARRGVIDKIEKYKWNLNTPIIVPSISTSRINLLVAFQSTLSQITIMSEVSGFFEDVKEIMDKGKLYFVVENNIPDYIKNMAFDK